MITLTVTAGNLCRDGGIEDNADCFIGHPDVLLRVSEDVLDPYDEGNRPVAWQRQ